MPQATSRTGVRRWWPVLLAVAVIGAGYFVETGGGHLFSNIPPEGTVWFGASFDPDTYEVRDRLTSVAYEQNFIMVGRLAQPLEGSRLVIRAYLNGMLTTIAWPSSTETGALWAFRLGPINLPGSWRYEIAEVGGGALASGEFLAEK